MNSILFAVFALVYVTLETLTVGGSGKLKMTVVLCQQPANPRVNRSAKQRRRLVPVALRAPAPGYAERSAA